MEFVVRTCGPGDETALSLVGAATVLETYAGISEGPDVYAHIAKELHSNAFLTLLRGTGTRAWLVEAADGRSAVGYGVVQPAPDGAADALELKRLYVLHRFAKLGLGARLMHEALDFARERGAVRVTLSVRDVNSEAIAFYERWGFRTVREDLYRAGAHDYRVFIMELVLGRNRGAPSSA